MNKRPLSPRIATSLATAVSAASSKAAIVSWSIAPGSMYAVNGSKTLVLSTATSFRVDHRSSFSYDQSTNLMWKKFVGIDAAGGDLEMRGARSKGADFNFKASSGFSFGSMFIQSTNGSVTTWGGAVSGLNLIPLKFTDGSGNRLLGVAEVNLAIPPGNSQGYANLVNFWYTNDPNVNELRWDAGSQQVLEVGPTPVPEPRGGAVVLLAGLAALAQSRRRTPQAKGLGVLAAGMGGLVARAGREES